MLAHSCGVVVSTLDLQAGRHRFESCQESTFQSLQGINFGICSPCKCTGKSLVFFPAWITEPVDCILACIKSLFAIAKLAPEDSKLPRPANIPSPFFNCSENY